MLKMSIVKGKKEELKAETENFSEVLWKKNKEEAKHKKIKIRNNKGTEKVEEKLQRRTLERQEKRIIKDETNGERSLIGINRGQGKEETKEN